MAYDFPASPTENQTYTPAGGPTYIYHAPAWELVTTAATGIPEAPVDGALYGRVNAAWAKGVKLAGDTMTGVLSASYTTGTIAAVPIAAPTQGLQLFSSSADANYIVFHSPGRYLAAFGLDTDSKFKIGGGSMGAVAHEIWHAGNFAPWNYLPLVGGTLTGSLIVDYANPAIQLKKTASGQNASLIGMNGANQRWNLILGDLTAESATATGSNFTINSYNNSGVYYQTPFQIDRASGTTFINNGLYMLAVSNRWDTAGNIVISTKGYQPGGGVWADSSDERIKTVLGGYTHGLAEILQLNPVRYQFKGNEYSALAAQEAKTKSTEPISDHRTAVGKEFVGLLAQEAEVPMPEMVTKIAGFIDGQPVNDLRVLDTTALIFALVNAVKELTARVEALEAAR